MIDYFEIKSQPITKAMVWQAYKKVKSNRGSAGIDGMDWKYLENNLSTQLYKLWNRLSSGTYFPKPVKEVAIRKKDGGIRKLGIPTILDRIAQEVVKHHLEKHVEPKFSHSSYGYRTHRSCHDAVKQSCSNCFNHDFAIDIDIKGFFDTIDHDLMLKSLKHYCQDKWVLMYVTRWLKSGIVSKEGKELRTELGTPQGGVISPLLANIFLHVVFDLWMSKEHPEKPFERYADDIVVHCKTEKQAQYVLRAIEKRMTACKLALHPEKTKIVNLRGKSEKKYPKSYDFLGFTIRPNQAKINGKYYEVPSIFISKKSRTSVLAKFNAIQIHKRRKSIELVAEKLNPIIRGILNYYHKFSDNHMRCVWRELNAKILKWVKWEKGLSKYKALYWLQNQYKRRPKLFFHWLLVHP